MNTMMTTMIKTGLSCSLGFALLFNAGAAHAQAEIGKPAPAISATDVNGKPVSLSDFKGKYVVIEWTNPGCPFVQKHYDGGNMPETQKQAIADGAVWISVQTRATAGDDAGAGAELKAWQNEKKAAPSTSLIDASGAIGKAYGARTTPHLYIVDPQGTLIYAGAIDSNPSADAADIPGATNYVKQTLGEAIAGKPVSRPATQPYGCSVKYPG
jgi:hypothetical protein